MLKSLVPTNFTYDQAYVLSQIYINPWALSEDCSPATFVVPHVMNWLLMCFSFCFTALFPSVWLSVHFYYSSSLFCTFCLSLVPSYFISSSPSLTVAKLLKSIIHTGLSNCQNSQSSCLTRIFSLERIFVNVHFYRTYAALFDVGLPYYGHNNTKHI